MYKSRHCAEPLFDEKEEERIRSLAEEIVDGMKAQNLTLAEALAILEECKALIDYSVIK